MDDLANGHKRGLVWRPDVAAYYIDYFAFLKHSKGEFAGHYFELAPWQKFRVGSVFGWHRKDGSRRFRTAYNDVARKNGKSTEAAGIGLIGLAADGEQGAEVYAAATKKDQARIVFDEARRMARSSPDLLQSERLGLRVFKNAIASDVSGSKFEPLSSDSQTADGLNPHFIIVDELHKHKTRDLLDVLDTAVGARRQPLLWIITTAGDDDVTTPYAQERDYAEKVVTGALPDDSLFVFIATLDPEDRWDDPKVWIKANPNLGISCSRTDLRRQASKAKGAPAAQASFKRLRLNIRTASSTQAIALERWNLCTEGVQDEAAYHGRKAYGAFDLASKLDLSAAALLLPPVEADERWKLFVKFWCPSENIADRADKDRAPYEQWVKDGWLEPTPGDFIDQSALKNQILEWNRLFRLEKVAFDPWTAAQLSIELQDAGVQVTEFVQGIRSYTYPTKEFMGLVQSRGLEHGGNPVLKWQASNLRVETIDKNGNTMPTKKKSTGRIDGMVSAIMAYGLALTDIGSVYEDRGLIVL